MKKIFGLALALLCFPAFAFNPQMETERTPAAGEGVQHMFEFNIDSILAGAVSFDKSKVKGTSSDNDTKANLSLNYAYGVAPLLQVASRFNYFSGISGGSDIENFDLSLGGILNNKEDFTTAGYVSLYVGAGWTQNFGASTRDDLRFASVALGKRFPLEVMGIKHVTYTPEVAVKMANSTNDSGLDYSQSLEFRFLQFSVFF